MDWVPSMLRLVVIHFVTVLVRQLQPSGVKAVAAENLVLKKQLLAIQCSRLKAPNLTTMDRFIFRWLAMMLSPRRMARSAIIIKPSAFLLFHKALVRRKYSRLFSSHQGKNPGLKAQIVI